MRYKEQAINTFKKIDTSNWNSFKDNVFIRLINKKIADTQPEYENAIKVPFMDLYKMFYIREIDRGNDIVYGYTLQKGDMKKFNVKFQKLSKQAQDNHNNDKKMRISTLKENIAKQSVFAPVIRIPDSAMTMTEGNMPGTIIDKDDNGNENILVVTNSMDVFGTSYMASQNMINEIWNRFRKENFYMISMTQNKLMCIREKYMTENGTKSKVEYEDDLFGMIDKMNSQVENWKDILSYRLYYFIGDDGQKIISLKET